MSLNETQIQNEQQMTACPQCCFMNSSASAFCTHCLSGLPSAGAPPHQFADQRMLGEKELKILNAVDFMFMIMSGLGLYWYYFDSHGVRTLAQKQFRLCIMIIGSFGMIAVWVTKLALKKSK